MLKRFLSCFFVALSLLVAMALPLVAQEMDHSHHQMMPMTSEQTFGPPVPAFELVNHSGEVTGLEDYRGQYILVGFGFTHCTYVCPTMAANMAGALRQLEDSDEEAMAIFISVDTERDSPEVTHRYAQAFHPDMVGLSGSHEQVSEAAKNFRVNFAVTKTPNDYSVQHTANIYVLDTEGSLLDSFGINATSEELAAAMK